MHACIYIYIYIPTSRLQPLPGDVSLFESGFLIFRHHDLTAAGTPASAVRKASACRKLWQYVASVPGDDPLCSCMHARMCILIIYIECIYNAWTYIYIYIYINYNYNYIYTSMYCRKVLSISRSAHCIKSGDASGFDVCV